MSWERTIFSPDLEKICAPSCASVEEVTAGAKR